MKKKKIKQVEKIKIRLIEGCDPMYTPPGGSRRTSLLQLDDIMICEKHPEEKSFRDLTAFPYTVSCRNDGSFEKFTSEIVAVETIITNIIYINCDYEYKIIL